MALAELVGAEELSRSFADRLRSAAPAGPRPLRLGIEQEHVVRRGDRCVAFGWYVPRLARLGVAVHPTDPTVHVLPSGLVLLADHDVAEAAAPPVGLGPGFAAALERWAAAGQVQLAGVLDPGERLEGGSTHLSVEVADQALNDRVALAYGGTYGPGLMLLLDRATSPGVLVRPRPGRTELCGEFATGAALRAAAAYAAGSVLAAADDLAAGCWRGPRPVEVALEAGRQRYGWYVDRRAFGPDLYAAGRTTVLRRLAGGTVTAQALLEHGWAVARARLAGLVDPADVDAADELVAGRLPLPLEDDDPPLAHAGLPPPSRAGDLGRATACRLRLHTATWEFAAFALGDGDRVAVVSHDLLATFLELLDAGELDDLLAAFLATPRADRIVARAADTTEPGLHDEVVRSPALLPDDRMGVGPGPASTVRPGKRVVPPPEPFVPVEPPPPERGEGAGGGIPWLPIGIGLVVLVVLVLLVTRIGGGGEAPGPPATTAGGSTPPTAGEASTCGDAWTDGIGTAIELTGPCTMTDEQLTSEAPYPSCDGCAAPTPFVVGEEFLECVAVDHTDPAPVDPDTGIAGRSGVDLVAATTFPEGTVVHGHVSGAGSPATGTGTVDDHHVLVLQLPIDSFGPWTWSKLQVVDSPDARYVGQALDPAHWEGGSIDVTAAEVPCDLAELAGFADDFNSRQDQVVASAQQLAGVQTVLATLASPGADLDLRQPGPLGVRLSDARAVGLAGLPGVEGSIAPDDGIADVAGVAASDLDAASADALFGHTELPCGAGPTAFTVCEAGEPPMPAGAVAVAFASLRNPVALGGDAPAQLSVFVGTDEYVAAFDPASGWQLSAPSGAIPGARLLLRNQALVLVAPEPAGFAPTGVRVADAAGDFPFAPALVAPSPPFTVTPPPAVAPASSTTTTTAAPTTTVATTAPPEDLAGFLDAFAAAYDSSDDAFFLDRLHPAVLERYGADQCRSFVASGFDDPGLRVVGVQSQAPEPFDFASDGLSRTVADAVTVVATVEDADGRRDQTFHLAVVDGRYRIFSDCGTPLPGAP